MHEDTIYIIGLDHDQVLWPTEIATMDKQHRQFQSQ